MGTIRVGSVVSDIRGKVGDEVYSRGPGGLQVRSVGTWTQPNTQRQIDCRTIAKKLAVAWSGLLSQVQRDAWRAYAVQWPRVNRWGEPLNIGGYQAFFRACAYYFRAEGDLNPANPVTNGDLLVKDAPVGGPTHPPLMEWSTLSVVDLVLVTGQPTNYPAMDGDCYLWMFGGVPVGQGVNYFGGPWRYLGYNKWTGSWKADPIGFTYPWAFDVGDKLHVECIFQYVDSGELSTRGRMVQVVTNPEWGEGDDQGDDEE